MKQKMVIVLLFCIYLTLSGTGLEINEIKSYYDDGVELLLTRLEYGTNREFLPPNLAMAIAVNELFPLQEDMYVWDMDLEEWVSMYSFSFTYADEYVSQMVMSIVMQGMSYQIITDFIWEAGLLIETDASTVLMEVTTPSMHEYYYYTGEELFESYLQEGWESGNEIWINLEQINTTIVDGKITVFAQDEYNYDLMDWVPEERRTYTWDGDLITSQLEEYFDSTNWINEDMFYMYYHESGLMDYILYQSWENGGWVDDNRNTYTYEDNLNTYTLTESWEEGAWVNDEELYITYDDQDRPVFLHETEFYEGEWINEQDTYIYYTLANDPDEIEPVSINMMVYPNPFNPSTTLSWQVNGSILPDKIAIYDIRGRKIDEIEVFTGADGKGSVIWDGNGAATGLYFFKLSGYETCGKGLLFK
ncbi:MAG: T9SS type A sorting domain-containing protein [Candidatus Cloacimonetes bacterium]|nr:T9SS type A sorting domain-containing protein [Candidatus Cloacimonadota bacterium]